MAGSIEYIRARRLRALAVTTATRSEALPDIPTIGELLPGFEQASGLVSMGPGPRRLKLSIGSIRRSMQASAIPN
jgi:tripartite-type tricarboxylate transporter receptor subunit TctC